MERPGFRKILRIILFIDEVSTIPRLIILGGTLVTTALTQISSVIRSLPLSYEILLGIGIFILWLTGVLAIVRWLKRRKLPNVIEGISDFTQKYADWLTTAIQDDVCDLPSCILIGEPHICWEHLKEREDAYIEFNFNIWSSSVLLLEISKQVEGHICFQGGELERIPEITQEASQLRHLRRSRVAHLKIRQWLSFPVKGRMKTEYGSQVEFDFSRVNISVVATLPDGSQGQTCRLPIPATVHAQMPDHPNPNAPVPDTRGSQS
jgi:hypothetical protein